MNAKRKPPDKRRLEAYQHIIQSLSSAYDVLIECGYDIDDSGLDPGMNGRDINMVLGWMHEAASEIYVAVPDLAPPQTPMPRRRWATDPKKRSYAKYSRSEVLSRLQHNLELSGLILRESLPLARRLRLGKKVSDRLKTVEDVRSRVTQEIWKDLSDRAKRSWIADGNKPEGVAEPPPADRERGFERLNEKLETALQLLSDCAGLVVELDIYEGKLSAIGSCLALISDVQDRVYKERPDLIPQFFEGFIRTQ